MSGVSTAPSRFPGWAKKLLVVVGVILLLLVIQTLPVFVVKPLNAGEYRSSNAVVYYERGAEAGAKEIFDLVNSNIGAIRDKMGFHSSSPLEICVYKTQQSLWIRKAGFVTLLLAPSWFIGESEAGVIRMVSPNTPVRGHTHDTILNGTLHEVVHSINYYINPQLTYFWDNGLATYLSKQAPERNQLVYASRPSMEQMKTDNALAFGNYGGYAYSYSYVDYLVQTYGWDNVRAYASGYASYEAAFGKSEQEIYEEWGRYLQG
jgi:hypothetical protein